MADYDERVCIFDIGSYSAYVGRADEDSPGENCFSAVTDESGKPVDVFGINSSDATNRSKSLEGLFCPMSADRISDKEKLASLYSFCFNQVDGNNSLNGAVINVPPLMKRSDREFLCEVMFEDLGLEIMIQEASGVLASYASGRVTSLCLSSGDGYSSVVALHEGSAIPMAVDQVPYGGRMVTQQLHHLIQQSSQSNINVSDDAFPGDELFFYKIKHSDCYIASDLEDELGVSEYSAALSRTYKLPDGQKIRVDNERFMAAESLFIPQRFNSRKNFQGLAEMIHNSLIKCPIQCRKELRGNVVLSGGNTLFAGFPERLEKDLQSFLPANKGWKIVSVPERKFLEWIGASVLGHIALENDPNLLCTKKMYEDVGSSCVFKNKHSFLNVVGAPELIDRS